MQETKREQGGRLVKVRNGSGFCGTSDNIHYVNFTYIFKGLTRCFTTQNERGGPGWAWAHPPVGVGAYGTLPDIPEL
jgi:hypothetical protein